MKMVVSAASNPCGPLSEKGRINFTQLAERRPGGTGQLKGNEKPELGQMLKSWELIF